MQKIPLIDTTGEPTTVAAISGFDAEQAIAITDELVERLSPLGHLLEDGYGVAIMRTGDKLALIGVHEANSPEISEFENEGDRHDAIR